MLNQLDHASLRPQIVAVVGVPSDEGSSFLRGPALAPPKIREALYSNSTNLSAECGIDLKGHSGWKDLGDLELNEDTPDGAQIEEGIAELLNRGARAVALGGDHAITYPVVRAHAKKYDRLTILHLDAHSDLYDEFEGNRFSNACPFARIMEQGLAQRLIQVGIRTMNPHQHKQATRFGVEVVQMKDVRPDMCFNLSGPIYVSLDIDVLDPAFAPGVSHHEPAGFTTRELLSLIQNLTGQIVGADIVEFNPLRDLQGITAMASAKLLKELVAKMIFRHTTMYRGG